MVSFPRALGAGVVLGIVESVIRFNLPEQTGLVDFVLFLAVVVAVFLQTRAQHTETATFSFAPRVRPVPERLREIWWVRRMGLLAGLAALAVAAAVPLVVTEASRHLLYTQILLFAIAALSLVVVTGWSGQLSLGQMAFAGIGALFAASAHRGLQLDIGWYEHRLFQGSSPPCPGGRPCWPEPCSRRGWRCSSAWARCGSGACCWPCRPSPSPWPPSSTCTAGPSCPAGAPRRCPTSGAASSAST
jgi:hypothetical protein